MSEKAPKEDEEKPDPRPAPKPGDDVGGLISETRGNYSSIVVDGHNATADSNTDAGAKEIREKVKGDLLRDLAEKIREALVESKARKEAWDNPLTRPPPGTDYGCHFVISVDTKLGWVDLPTWRRCHDGDWPENQHRRKKKSK